MSSVSMEEPARFVYAVSWVPTACRMEHVYASLDAACSALRAQGCATLLQAPLVNQSGAWGDRRAWDVALWMDTTARTVTVVEVPVTS